MVTKSDLSEVHPAACEIAHAAVQLVEQTTAVNFERVTAEQLQRLKAHAEMLSKALAEFAKGCELAIDQIRPVS